MISNKFLTLALAALISAAAAQSADVSAVLQSLAQLKTDSDSTDALVAQYDSSQGVGPALAIQTNDESISSDVSQLVSNVNALSPLSASDSQSFLAALDTAGPSIVQLLKDITAKYSDFSAVGVSTIVQNDLTSLQQSTNSLESATYSKVDSTTESDFYQSFDLINQAFALAIEAYQGTVAPPPPSPIAAATAATSVAATSVAATSAAETTAAAAASSAPAAAGEGSTLYETKVVTYTSDNVVYETTTVCPLTETTAAAAASSAPVAPAPGSTLYETKVVTYTSDQVVYETTTVCPLTETTAAVSAPAPAPVAESTAPAAAPAAPAPGSTLYETKVVYYTSNELVYQTTTVCPLTETPAPTPAVTPAPTASEQGTTIVTLYETEEVTVTLANGEVVTSEEVVPAQPTSVIVSSSAAAPVSTPAGNSSVIAPTQGVNSTAVAPTQGFNSTIISNSTNGTTSAAAESSSSAPTFSPTPSLGEETNAAVQNVITGGLIAAVMGTTLLLL